MQKLLLVFLVFSLNIELFSQETYVLSRTINSEEKSMWMQMINRGDALNDAKGFLRDYDSRMDEEYRMDLLSYDYLMSDDYLFHEAESGIRSWLGSINTSRFFTNLDIKIPVPISEKYELSLEFNREESYQADHNILFARFKMNELMGSPFSAYVEFTAQTVKEDLDLIFGGVFHKDRVHIDFQIALLDFLNDVIHEGDGIKENQQTYARLYDSFPLALRLRGEVVLLDNLRMEFGGAVNLLEESNINFKDSTGSDFDRKQQFGYFVGLIEWDWKDNLTMGAMVEGAFGDDEIDGASSESYSLNESRIKYSLYGFYHFNEKLIFEEEAKFITYFYDLNSGSSSKDFDNEDWGLQYSLQAVYKFHKNWHVIGGIFVDRHVMTPVIDEITLTGTNVRFKQSIRFQKNNFYFMLTNNIGLEDLSYRYDGSSGQMGYTW